MQAGSLPGQINFLAAGHTSVGNAPTVTRSGPDRRSAGVQTLLKTGYALHDAVRVDHAVPEDDARRIRRSGGDLREARQADAGGPGAGGQECRTYDSATPTGTLTANTSSSDR